MWSRREYRAGLTIAERIGMATTKMTVTSGAPPRQRTVTLEVGKEYMIKPINPHNRENRGRKCLLLEFVPYSYDKPDDIVAIVKFLDNLRKGRIELEDLVDG
jgi:hypothetical protein